VVNFVANKSFCRMTSKSKTRKTHALAGGTNPPVLKTVLLGKAGTGKSCVGMKFVTGKFLENTESTIGAALMTKTVMFSDGKVVQLEIWDTAGQERFQSILPMYYRGAHAALIVYDITDAGSFVEAQDWVFKIKEDSNVDAAIMIAGNKVDRTHERVIQFHECERFAKAHDLLFMEVSAKSNKLIDETFFALAERANDKFISSSSKPHQVTNAVDLKEKKQSRPCCSSQS